MHRDKKETHIFLKSIFFQFCVEAKIEYNVNGELRSNENNLKRKVHNYCIVVIKNYGKRCQT